MSSIATATKTCGVSKLGMASYFTNQTLAGAIKLDSTGESGNGEYESEGFFFRGQYDYDQKYFASLSFRRDASSRFDQTTAGAISTHLVVLGPLRKSLL